MRRYNNEGVGYISARAWRYNIAALFELSAACIFDERGRKKKMIIKSRCLAESDGIIIIGSRDECCI